MTRLTILFFLIFTACSSAQTPAFRSGNPGPSDKVESTSTPETRGPQDSTILLSWPLRGVVDITRSFSTGPSPHQGMDLATRKGTPVLASHDGYVEYAGRDFNGYGNLIIINSGNRWATFYGHLNKIRVHEGQNVVRGDIIGDVGATGNARGVHLHFELRYNQSPVDPAKYLP